MVAIEIRSNIGCPNRTVREFTELRIRFALGRFRDLRRVVVCLEDVNGPKGGPDKVCRILAEFAFAEVIVEEVRPAWQSSVAHAIDRLAQQTARKLGKRKRSSCRGDRRAELRTARVP